MRGLARSVGVYLGEAGGASRVGGWRWNLAGRCSRATAWCLSRGLRTRTWRAGGFTRWKRAGGRRCWGSGRATWTSAAFMQAINCGRRATRNWTAGCAKVLPATSCGFQRSPCDLEVHGGAGKPLTLIARDEQGNVARVESVMPLAVAEKQPLSTEKLREQLGRLGGTPFELGGLENHLSGAVMLPVSELNCWLRGRGWWQEWRRCGRRRNGGG